MLCHCDEVSEQPIEHGPMNAGWTDLGAAAGSVDVGLRRIRIAPGAQSTPPHVHGVEEELCYVVGGEGPSWRAGARGLTVLAYGERKADDVAWYPRSQKVFMRGLGVAFRVQEVDYWEGEA